MTEFPKAPIGISLPREYQDRKDEELRERILAHKERLGDELTILGHHYQGDAIVDLSDFIGDSFKLCRDAADATAKYIVFCGVRFMAESARILARDDQVVIHPEESAGCPMADMADLPQVEQAWELLTKMNPGRTIVPITYMNSSSEIKAFCGAHGGSVCTSSNARGVLDWAYAKGDMVLFFPDEHLARNTAHNMGMDASDILIWNPKYAEAHGRDERYSQARLVVWKGFCHVHTFFKKEHIDAIREKYPDAFVIVHPECPREVVEACDDAGSTEAIVRRVREAKAGETIAVGTEINLVSRLAKQNPDVKVVPVMPSMCLNMAKVTLGHLLWVLDNLGAENVVKVNPEIKENARKALQQMLDISQ
ncbi:MAG: quinolinate synthase NadA [Candidatus Sumerlaeia bacterium]